MATTEERNAKTISTRDILFVVFRHKVKMAAFFSFTLIFVIAGLYVWPPSYRSSGLLLIKLGREHITTGVMPSTSQQVMNMGLTSEQVNSEIEIIKSDRLVNLTVEELGVDFLFPESVMPTEFWPRMKAHVRNAVFTVRDFGYEILYTVHFIKELTPYQEAVTAIKKKLKAGVANKSNIIEVQLTWNDPDAAAAIVNKVLDLYMSQRIDMHKTSGALKIFRDEASAYGEKLARLEKKLQVFRETSGVVATDLQNAAIIERTSELKKNHQMNQNDTVKTQEEINQLKKRMGQVPGAPKGEGPLAAVSPKTVPASSKGNFPNFFVNLPELEIQLRNAEVRLAGLQKEEESIRGQLTEDEAVLQELGQREVDLRRLERDYEIADKNYRLYMEKMEELRISEVMDREKIENVSIVSAAQAPFKPSKPRKLLILLAGLLVALAGAVALAFYSEFLDHTINKDEDVERYLRLSVLASVRKV